MDWSVTKGKGAFYLPAFWVVSQQGKFLGSKCSEIGLFRKVSPSFREDLLWQIPEGNGHMRMKTEWAFMLNTQMLGNISL